MPIDSEKRVLVAMSGGGDSSVTAGLLRDAGFEVTGVFMCLGTAGDPDSDSRGCCSPQDAADARAVAHKLGIELYVLNLAEAFEPIIEYFVDEYRHGHTPNPCVPCNAQIKFGRLPATRTSPTCCSELRASCWGASCFPWAICPAR